jgi:hypothetical protein
MIHRKINSLALAGAAIYTLSVFTAFAASDAGLILGTPVQTNGQMLLPVTGEAGVIYVVEHSPDLQSWTPVATNYAVAPGIIVDAPADIGFYRASRGPRPLFGLIALGSIDLKGNNVSTDSYDSTDPNYSTNGLYIASRRRANGDVVTCNQITNSGLSIGNANIAGHVRTAPGGTIGFLLNASVGSLSWVGSNTSGIQPGYSNDDVNVVFHDVVLPSVPWTLAGGAGTGGSGTAPDGNFYDHVFTSINDTVFNPGNYTITDNGTIYVQTNVGVRLNITTTNSYGPNNIFVAGATTNEAGRMIAYLNGPSSLDLNTNIRSQSGLPASLEFYGMPSLIGIHFINSGDWTGTIYAPEADLTLSGGGSSTQDIYGSSVTKTVNMNGHWNFHFDESLRN